MQSLKHLPPGSINDHQGRPIMTLTKSFRHMTAALFAAALSAVFVLSAVGPAEIGIAPVSQAPVSPFVA
ncbi:MAG: hypothetical protein A4S12_02495 [Proteobacteria bacterium SG_bin5]|nr:MAG: hypothetical protein A4S12_02495 [Proteobacteria bacterium SG_bin5]